MLKTKLTKVLSATLCATLALTVAGATSLQTAKAAATKTITFWHGWTGAEVDTLNIAIKKFQSANPGVKVQAVAVPFAKLEDKLKVALIAGTSPTDVFVGPTDWLGTFATMNGGTLQDLSQTTLKNAVKSMKKGAINEAKYKGKLLAFPESVESVVLLYNKNVVKTAPKTYDEMMKIAKSYTNTKKGTFGLVTDKGNYYHERCWFGAFGGSEFTDPDKGISGYNTKAFSDFLTLMRSMNKSGVMPKTCNGDTATALFAAGKAAFMINGPWTFGDIDKSAMKGHWGITNIPTVNGKTPQPFIGEKLFYIPKNSKNVNEAAEFVKFMTSKDTQTMFAEKNGHIPANSTVKVKDWEIQGVMDQAEVADAMPNIPEMGEVWTPAGDAITKAMDTNDPIKNIASDTYKKIQAGIDKLHGN